jgi:hypothetical protein
VTDGGANPLPPPATLGTPPDQRLPELSQAAPGGFDHCFDELAAAMAAADFGPEKAGRIGARDGLEFDPGSVPRLCAEHGLDHPCCTSRRFRLSAATVGRVSRPAAARPPSG